MRYINRDAITLPDGWAEKAQRASDALKSLPPEERKQVINKESSSKIWKDRNYSVPPQGNHKGLPLQ